MTERFTVPAPSAKAMAWSDRQGTPALRVKGAFDMDLPAILRAEVERALKLSNKDWLAASAPEYRPFLPMHDGLYDSDRDYLTARYGPAPETVRGASVSGVVFDEVADPPGAPTFTREAEAFLRRLADYYWNDEIEFDDCRAAARAYLASREGR